MAGGLFATTFCDIAKAKNHPDELQGEDDMARHITQIVAVAEGKVLAMDRVNCWIDAMIPCSQLDGKLKLKRLIGTGGGLIFKGSGFYLTDYRSDSYKKGAEADKKTPETSDDSSSKKSSDKPAKKKGKDGKKKAS